MWDSSLLPLNKGYDASSAINSLELNVLEATNLDFGVDNAVRPRPPLKEKQGFNALVMAATNTMETSPSADRTGLGLVDGNSYGMFSVKSGSYEVPGLILKGRIYTFDTSTNLWNDKWGTTPKALSRSLDTWTGLFASSGGPPAISPATTFLAGGAISYNFGYTDAQQITCYDQYGIQSVVHTVTYGNGCGTGAVCPIGSVMAHQPQGTALIVLTVRTNAAPDTITQYLISSAAQTVKGQGDSPVICCDYDETSVYICYINSTNGINVAKVVPSTGVITFNITVLAASGTTKSIWVSNSTKAGNRFVVTAISTLTERISVFNATTAASVTSRSTGTIANVMTQVGIVDTIKGRCTVTYGTTAANFTVYRFNLVTAAYDLVLTYTGGGGYGTNTKPSWFLAHQPAVVDSRDLVGISKAGGWGTGFGNTLQACTWFVLDITDIAIPNSVGFVRYKPQCVAKGALDGSMQPIQPASAMLPYNSPNYRFQTVEWRGFSAAPDPENHVAVFGFDGSLGLNQIDPLNPQYTFSGASTVLAGAIPQIIHRGIATEVGFPEDRPWVSITLGAAAVTAIQAGDYTAYAVWRWVDEVGVVHRSAPSVKSSLTVAAAGANFVNITYNLPQITTKYNVTVELYVTEPSPVGVANHFLQGVFDSTGLIVFGGFTYDSEVLYTDGGVLENQCPNASGGIFTLGVRTWLSDGSNLFASKLPRQGLATAWNMDDPLTVFVPASAGRITALSGVDDKLFILCQRGIFGTSGAGPDDLGNGDSFLDPVRVSNIGIESQRLVQATSSGIVFKANNTDSTNLVGGIFSIDRSANVARISGPLDGNQAFNFTDFTWWADREQLWLFNDTNTVVFDARNKQWALIETVDALSHGVACGTYMYTSTSSSQGRFNDGTIGQDFWNGVSNPYRMALNIEPLSAGKNVMDWGRVRGYRILADYGVGMSYTITLGATLDNVTNVTGSTVITTDSNTTWPTSGSPIEYRFTKQKCSRFSVNIEVTPAVLTMTAIEIDHKAIGRAPAKVRF